MKRLLGVILAASLPLIACAPAPHAVPGPSQEKMQVKIWRGAGGWHHGFGFHRGFGLNRGIWGLGAPFFGLGYGGLGLPWLRGYGIGPWGLGWGWGLGAAAWPYPQGYAGLGLGTFAYGMGLGGLGLNPLINNPLIPGAL